MTKATFLAAAAATSAALTLSVLAYQYGKKRGQLDLQSPAIESDGSCDVSGAAATSSCSEDKVSSKTSGTGKLPKMKVNPSDELDMLPIYPIGTLRSIYRLCVGTPRQVSLQCVQLFLVG